MFEELLTPRLLVDRDRVARNIRRMQDVCDSHGVALWPHIKTHKSVEVARMQLAAGARGLVCAKIGEAEVMLASGARSVFIAHSIVDPLNAPRLCALSEQLDELLLAVTSEEQAPALEAVLARADLRAGVLMAVDTGQGREGARGSEGALRLAALIGRQPHMELRGIYSHEGHAYAAEPGKWDAVLHAAHERLLDLRARIDPALSVWPGCSVTAARMATMPGVDVVRPGTYVYGDLSLAAKHAVMDWDDVAATVLSTVVDKPEPGLAFLDAGSKSLSSDKSSSGVHAALHDRRRVELRRLNEEHGWATGVDVDQLRVGERVRLVSAHICPVINLADEVSVIGNGQVVDTWRVDARGKSA